MTEYTWTFSNSFLVFLLIAFGSMALAEKLRSRLPMPLLYGVFFIVGFATGVLPTDLLQSSNMVAVGTIAFNVLVVHSGTMINLHLLREKWRETLLCLVAFLILLIMDLLVLIPLLGRSLALLVPGSVVGGGASCAIASRWISGTDAELAVFPWLIFMGQGVFSVPVVTWALRRESKRLLRVYRSCENGEETTTGAKSVRENSEEVKSLCRRIPGCYKSTPYYLGSLMVVTVFNNLLHETVLAGLNLNPYITALLFGAVLGNLGILDRAPLFHSDSYGLLILGLMGLMANTLAGSSWQSIVRYIPALLVVFLFSSAVLLICAAVGARLLKISTYRAAALLTNCMMGYPVNRMLLEQAAQEGDGETEQFYLRTELEPVLNIGTTLITNGLSVLVVGILVLFV